MSGRLPTCTPAQAERALRRAGFVLHHSQGAHRYYWHAGRGVMMTIAYHARDLKRGTLTGIIKQAGLTIDEFTSLLRG
jgi:predicted RNA binding protein YcfA (HicA-like mRNA interferase family)